MNEKELKELYDAMLQPVQFKVVGDKIVPDREIRAGSISYSGDGWKIDNGYGKVTIFNSGKYERNN